MNTDERFIELWNDFLEGELDAPGMTELQQLIAGDDQLPATAADSYQLHRMLGMLASENATDSDSFVRQTMSRLPTKRDSFVRQVMQQIGKPQFEKPSRSPNYVFLQALAIAAILVAAAMGGMLILQPDDDVPIAKIAGLSGSLLWTGNGGQVEDRLQQGANLGGGTLEGLAPDSWVALEFRDGSTVTIAGKSLLTFSEQERQKRLHLREGSITASVAPQPDGKPMLVHTRSARLEVVGTQFKVDAGLAATMLNVSEGSVRVQRLSDGKSVHVPANHRVVASADRQLTPEEVPGFVDHWESQMQLGPDETFGKWLPAAGSRPARLRAIPYVFTPPGDDSVTLYLAAMSISKGDSRPVMLQAASRFSVSGTTNSDCTLIFGITVNNTDGEFAGKFITSEAVSSFAEQGDFQVELELRNFTLDPTLSKIKKLKNKLPDNPANLLVADFWCLTLNEPVGLTVTDVKLLPP